MIFRIPVLQSISLLSDCWYGAKDEETPPEQRVSVEQESQARTPKACPSTQKTHPCEKCVSSLKDILHLTELQAIYPGQEPHLGGVSRGFRFSENPHHYQKHGSGEKIFRMGTDRASFVTSRRFHVSGKPFTCREDGRDFLATLGLFQRPSTPN